MSKAILFIAVNLLFKRGATEDHRTCCVVFSYTGITPPISA